MLPSLHFNDLFKREQLKSLFLTIFFLGFFYSHIDAQILYVDSSRASSGAGTSWETAFKSLNDALVYSVFEPNIKEIRIAKGTYYPSSDGDRNTTFLIYRANLILKGGYASGGGSRNLSTYKTILSGDVGVKNDFLDNSYHTLVIANISSSDNIIFDGLHIYGGNANGTDSYTYRGASVPKNVGGGIVVYNSNAHISFINCQISANNAKANGGGVYILNSDPKFINCILSCNIAQYGGAVALENTIQTEFFNCTMAGNRSRASGNSGGCIYNVGSSNPGIYNSILWGNSSGITSPYPTVRHSLVQGYIINYNNLHENNLDGDIDPLFFVKPTTPGTNDSIPTLNGNLHLRPGSQCTNAGNNTFPPSNITTDLDGKTRYVCSNIDLGPYESEYSRLYVKQDANGTGISWADASGDLQLMINGACSGTEIWVAEGTYKPNRPINNLNVIQPNNKQNSFVLKSGVKIYGGFYSNGNPTFSDRNFNNYASRLSGDIGVVGSPYDNCYYVVTSNGDVGDAELNGFIVHSGQRGIYIENSSPTISNVIISNNYDSSYYFFYPGCGLTIINSKSKFNNIQVHDNFSISSAGGIYSHKSSSTFDNVRVYNNTSRYNGGGLYIEQSSSTFNNCEFQNNISNKLGGGIYMQKDSSDFINCTIKDNSSESGGGIYSISSQNTLFKNQIIQNKASKSGGGIYQNDSDIKMHNSLIAGNFAKENGGGLYNENNKGIITNSIISGNILEKGIGSAIMNFNNQDIHYINSVISGNYVKDPYFNKSIVDSYNSKFTNCIIWGNEDDDEINLLGVNNSIFPNSSLLYGSNNSREDPLFIDAPPYFSAPFVNGDYRVQIGSPAINAGSNDVNSLIPNIDLDSNPRILEDIIDIGAFEFTGVSSPENKILIKSHPKDLISYGIPSMIETFSITQENGQYFQWQVDEGQGFVDIEDDYIYHDTKSENLKIRNIGFFMYGFKYRCVVFNDKLDTIYSNPAALYIYKILYVREGATGDGSSWSNASGDIQEMINKGGEFTEIRISEGTYYPNRQPTHPYNVTPNNSKNAFLLKPNVRLFGGFPKVGSPSIYDRNWELYPTIISGDLGDPGNDNEENTSQLIAAVGNMGLAEINGLILQSSGNLSFDNYTIDGHLIDRNNGSAISIVYSNLILKNLIFRQNRAANAGGGIFASNSNFSLENVSFIDNFADKGAALYCVYSDYTIKNCSFLGNQAVSGGAIFNYHSNSHIDSSSFYNNESYWDGGAISSTYSTTSTVSNCIFSSNQSQNGGAIYYEDNTHPRIENSQFKNNYASERGGALYSISCDLIIENCDILKNSSGLSGGGIYNYATSESSYSYLKISGNTSKSGAGMYNMTNSYFYNCLFSGNKAYNDGAGLLSEGDYELHIVQCTFSGNHAQSSGSSIKNSSRLNLVSSILWGNFGTGNGDFAGFNANRDIVFNCILPTAPTGSLGTIVQNPKFVDPISFNNAPSIDGNYRLQACASPAIDAVIPNDYFVRYYTDVDLDGNKRKYGNGMDLGAYETHSIHIKKPIIYSCTNNTSISVTPISGATYQWQYAYTQSLYYYNIPPEDPYFSGIHTPTLTMKQGGEVIIDSFRFRCVISGCNSFYITDEVEFYINKRKYVREGGIGDGSSWENASGDLQAMINQSCSNSEIWVAQGTYTPIRPANNLNTVDSTNRNNAFVLKSGVKIFGGFSSIGNPTFDDRNWNLYPTILSGEIGNPNDITDNCIHVVISSGNSNDTELDGFIISNGYCNETNISSISVNGHNVVIERGAGIAVANSSPRLTNIIFRKNVGYAGAAIGNTISYPILTNVLITDNISSYSALYNNNSSPKIYNTTIAHNTALVYENNGIGIRNIGSSIPYFYNTIIWNNTKADGNDNNIYNKDNYLPVFFHSNIQGISNGWENIGVNMTHNIEENPLFVDPKSGNYRLKVCSPSINAGKYEVSWDITTKDLDGKPRHINGNIDMGAYQNYSFNISMSANTHSSADNDCIYDNQWKHYYREAHNELILSLNTHNQDLGNITISSSMDNSFGIISPILSLPYGQSKKIYPFNRSWTIQSQNSFAQPVSVRFYFSNRDTLDILSRIPYQSIQNLILYKVDGNDVMDTDARGYKEYHFGEVADTNTFILGEYQGIKYAEFKVKSFSSGTMAMSLDEAILPLDLLSFNAYLLGEQTHLNWLTVNEENVSHFEIERSTDGKNWIKCGTQAAYNGIEQHYEAIDPLPSPGINYYRLKMIDLDESFKYSHIIQVNFDPIKKKDFVIYPNPNNGSFKLIAKGIANEETHVYLYDGLGRLVHHTIIYDGLNQIETNNLSQGMYILHLKNNLENYTQKIVIE